MKVKITTKIIREAGIPILAHSKKLLTRADKPYEHIGMENMTNLGKRPGGIFPLAIPEDRAMAFKSEMQ